jgi:hypothetical protein
MESGSSKVEAMQEVQSLKDSVADEGEIVKQLAIFVGRPPHSEQRLLMAGMILHLLDLQPKIVIPVLAPYLDADHPRVRSFVRNWFRGHDNAGSDESPLKPVNYEDYLTYAQVQLNINEELPTAFVEYLYERSPERALMIFHRANPRKHAETGARLRAMRERLEADRQQLENQGPDAIPPRPDNPRQRENKGPDEIFVAEKIISHAISLKNWENGKLLPEAKAQLAKLANHDEWWVRLYVAEIMRRHRELRVVEILEKLAGDSNSLVSKAAKPVKE